MLLLVSASRTVQTYISERQAEELRRLEAATANIPPGIDVTVTGSAWFSYIAPASSMDEFGIMSSARLWVPEPVARLIRWQTRDRGSATSSLSIGPPPRRLR
jgi:hypothetical protein